MKSLEKLIYDSKNLTKNLNEIDFRLIVIIL
jgi:hypothetical protein